MKICDFTSHLNGEELEFAFFPKKIPLGDYVSYKFIVYVYPTFREFHFGKIQYTLRKWFWIGNVGIVYR